MAGQYAKATSKAMKTISDLRFGYSEETAVDRMLLFRGVKFDPNRIH